MHQQTELGLLMSGDGVNRWAFFACRACRNVVVGTKETCPACETSDPGWKRVIPSERGIEDDTESTEADRDE